MIVAHREPEPPAIETDEQSSSSSLARWLRSHASGTVQALIIGISVVMASAWIAVDRSTPAWDQSHYLWDSLQYVDGFRSGGVGGLVHAVFTVDPLYAPGYPLLIFPFLLILGPSVHSALVANVLLWIVLLLTVGAIARRLFGKPAAPVAMAVCATIPLLLWLVHDARVDLAVATWTCLAVLAMLRSSHFRHPLPAVFAGLFAGLAVLTKVSALGFLAAPVLVIGARALLQLWSSSTEMRMRVAGSMLLALGAFVAVAAPWYWVNLQGTLAYIQSSTSGAGAAGAGPQTLNLVAFTQITVMVANDAPWVLVAGIVAVAGVVVSNHWRPKAPSRTGKRWSWLLVVTMAAAPVAILFTSHDQASRYAVVTYPALAILFAGLIVATRPRFLRFAALAMVLLFGVAQIGVSQLPIGSAAQRGTLVGFTSNVLGGVVLFGPAYPFANPTGDDGTPVMQELEALAHGRPAKVLIAQEDHSFNWNTLTWLAATRHDQLSFYRPDLAGGNPSELASYDLAVYLPAKSVVQRNPDLRASILNGRTATAVYGDQLFSIFALSKHEVALGDGTTVWVLQQR